MYVYSQVGCGVPIMRLPSTCVVCSPGEVLFGTPLITFALLAVRLTPNGGGKMFV